MSESVRRVDDPSLDGGRPVTGTSVTPAAGPTGTPETARLRMMTFEAPSMVIELARTTTGVVGQLVPPDAGSASLWTASSITAPVEIDHCGCFVIAVRPTEPFRLACSTAGGLRVVTDWITP